ncbi:MAG: hypothetical protein IT210_03710 [Armatimonadetes bacterium]|nr:hypothetical protein [Armatimonadota bacterium]
MPSKSVSKPAGPTWHHTYGNTDTWNFGSYREEGIEDWKTALHSPGAKRLSALVCFYKSLRWWEMEPAPDLLSGSRHPAAMRSVKGDCLLAYLSDMAPATFRLKGLAGPARASWVDPQTGKKTAIGDWQPETEQSLALPAGWLDALLLVKTGPGGKERQ